MDTKNLEQQLADALNQEELKQRHREQDAVKHLSPKYEMRQTTQFDPIVEETKIIRSMAKELDGRYDKYMAKADQKAPNKDDGQQK